jgi:hypothetical protein
MGFNLDDSKPNLHKTSDPKSKKEILQSLVGAHYLRSVSSLVGMNTITDYSFLTGQWKATMSTSQMGKREAFDVDLDAETIKTLKSLKIVVAEDLSLSLLHNGFTIFSTPFNENGLNYGLKNSTNGHFSIPEGLSPNTTILDNYLYIMVHDGLCQSDGSFAEFSGATSEVLIIKYSLENKEFEVQITGIDCCNSATFAF